MVSILSGVADVDDGCAEFLGFVGADAADRLQLSDGARADEDDAAEGGGAEDEKLRQADALGFGFAPGAELGVEELLVGSERGGWVGGGGAGAVEGFRGFAKLLDQASAFFGARRWQWIPWDGSGWVGLELGGVARRCSDVHSR